MGSLWKIKWRLYHNYLLMGFVWLVFGFILNPTNNFQATTLIGGWHTTLINIWWIIIPKAMYCFMVFGIFWYLEYISKSISTALTLIHIFLTGIGLIFTGDITKLILILRLSDYSLKYFPLDTYLFWMLFGGPILIILSIIILGIGIYHSYHNKRARTN